MHLVTGSPTRMRWKLWYDETCLELPILTQNPFLSFLSVWDRARALPAYRLAGVALGMLVLLVGLGVSLPEGLTEPARRAGLVTMVMSLWWLGGVLPMAVTAMAPLVLFPLLGIMPIQEAAAPYADPLIFLMLGGFILAHAMEEVGIHRRLLALLLGPVWVRSSPRRIVLALMLTAGVVSSFVSNTATMVMMLPLGLSLVSCMVEHHPTHANRLRSASLLGLAYACSIGGVSTLVGTAPNAVFARTAKSITNQEIAFLDWSLYGVPFVLLALPMAWWIVTHLALPIPERCEPPIPRPAWPEWSKGERIVMAVIGLCFLAWVTRQSQDFGGGVKLTGWGTLLPAKVDDGWVAITAGLLLFCLPGGGREEGESGGEDASEERFLLSWRKCARAMPWSVLTLLGGGFAMAEGIEATKLTDFLAARSTALAGLPDVVTIGMISVGISFLSAFTSNTATTQVALPLLGSAAAAAGINPILWMAPATVAASCDFTMAAGTPPNAIAAEAGNIAPADMAFAGFFLNITCAILGTGLSLLLAGWIWGP